MVLYEQRLVDELRLKCESAQKRIWVASPYIGSLKDVQKVLGGRWMLPSIDCRILTDIDNGFIREDTFKEFKCHDVEIRTLESLHAKIYIIDDWCLVTSANLTGTAFYCRYEMGVQSDDVSTVVDVFNKWWKTAEYVDALKYKPSKSLLEYQDGKHFKRKFKATPYTSAGQDKYEARCEKYTQFARLYEKLTGRNIKMIEAGFTLYQEVDYFFNYLVHEHTKHPINNASVSSVRRDAMIRKYFTEMCEFYDNEPQSWRIDRTRIVQEKLSVDNIDNLNWRDVKEVVNCLHCLLNRRVNLNRILNQQINSLKEIRRSWKMLLHDGKITSDKVKYVNDNLYGFGTSSIYELIGWYYPEKYPLMNGASDKCMNFFGFEI